VAAEYLNWQRRILPYLNDDAGRYTCWDAGSINTWCWPDQNTQQHTVYRGNKIFICPSNDYLHPGVPWVTSPGNSSYWGSYAGVPQAWYTGPAVGEGVALWPIENSPLLHPAFAWDSADAGKWPLVVEGHSGLVQGLDDLQMGWYFSNQHLPNMTWSVGYFAGDSLFQRMHAEKNNFLMGDGHIVTRAFDLDQSYDYWSNVNRLRPILYALDNF
jgi:prepilin-type processing-associated H-X9-DG protein